MSDISIPGVSSRFNTDQMVEELVNAEKVALTRLENRVAEFEAQKRTWQDMTRQLSSLSDVARGLYSFENPFNERQAVSSNEAVVSASADRNAAEGSTEVEVLRSAGSDRFSSGDLPRDLRVEQGVYTFLVGDTRAVLRFRGGTVREFSEALNRVNPSLISSSVINNRPGTQVLLVESMKQGAANPLGFDDAETEDLAVTLGLIGPSDSGQIHPSLEPARLLDASGRRNPTGAQFSGEALSAAPGSTIRIPLNDSTGTSPTNSMVVEFEARYVEAGLNESGAQGPPPGFQIDPGAGIEFEGIALPDLPSAAPDPDFALPEPPQRVDTADVLSLLRGSTSRALDPVTNNFRTVQIPIEELGFLPSDLQITNTNTHRNIELRNLRLYDPNARGDYAPTNPLSVARDAVLKVQGIEIERESNTIDDVIPGVTLTLQPGAEGKASITVSPDRERVKEALIEYVAAYNQVIRDINILTRTQPEIVDEITYFTSEEREEALEKLGSFQGNTTLNTIRQRLQNLLLTPVATDAGRDMALLAQAGISTNASAGAGSLQVSRLRGYLEINEDELDRALSAHFSSVKQLFGVDTDGDLIVDSGLAFSTETLVRPFVQTGGLLASNTQSLDRQISRTQEDITDYQEYLEDYEQRMRIQFGQMEAAINSLESQSREIEGLNQQNQN